MKHLLLASVAVVGITTGANAALIAAFSQNFSLTPTVTATDNGTTTTITVTDASTTITTGASGTIPNALFSFAATSIDAATPVLGAVIQHYSGSFCFSSAASCGGVNILSGTFSDAAFGALGGPGLTVNVNNPPDTLVLASDLLPASSLQAPSTFNLGFADLTPVLHINGTTIAAFTADFAGDVSATAAVVPEPGTQALLGVGLLGLGMIRARSRP